MAEFSGAQDACAPVQQDAVASRFKVGDRVMIVNPILAQEEAATVKKVTAAMWRGAADGKLYVLDTGMGCYSQELVLAEAPDSVNHPAHYTQYPVEVIEITEHLNFCRGNAVKYICRAGHKGDELEDLRKALWYIRREIERLEKPNG